MLLKVRVVGLDPPEYAYLKKDGYYNIEVESPFTVNDLLIFFGYGGYKGMIVNVNGNVAENDKELTEADMIMLMHAVYGG